MFFFKKAYALNHVFSNNTNRFPQFRKFCKTWCNETIAFVVGSHPCWDADVIKTKTLAKKCINSFEETSNESRIFQFLFIFFALWVFAIIIESKVMINQSKIWIFAVFCKNRVALPLKNHCFWTRQQKRKIFIFRFYCFSASVLYYFASFLNKKLIFAQKRVVIFIVNSFAFAFFWNLFGHAAFHCIYTWFWNTFLLNLLKKRCCFVRG